LGKPSKSHQTLVTTFSFLKNQNRYLPHFKCPLKNIIIDRRTISKLDVINGLVVGGTRRDDDVTKKERVLSN
jgi:hypothetical protein